MIKDVRTMLGLCIAGVSTLWSIGWRGYPELVHEAIGSMAWDKAGV